MYLNSNLTIGDKVYNTLRHSIIELNIKPGEIVTIKDISTQMNVSRSPVRDALIKLEKEGLITSMPQRGTMISKIDLSKVNEERFLRECIEQKVIRIFMEKYSDSDILKLKNILKRQTETAEIEEYRQSLDYDDCFHRVFFEVADKIMCWDTIQNVCGNYRRIRLLSLMERDISDSVIYQHKMLIQYIESRQIKNLIELLNQHLTKLDTEEKELMKRFPELFKGAKVNAKQTSNILNVDFLNMLKMKSYN